MGKFAEFMCDFTRNWNDLKNTVESHTGIITAAGIGIALVGTVVACKATLKINQKAEEHCKMVKDTKDSCAEKQLDEKQTKKEVTKVYKHVVKDYVKTYLPAAGLLVVGFGLIIKAHNIEVAKNEALMASYIGLETLFNKYRATVAERYGEEAEQNIMTESQIKYSEGKSIDNNKTFVNGSYLLFNENCTDFQPHNPHACEYLIRGGQDELNAKYHAYKRVYVNEVMRCFGHPEIKGGWKWCWYKGCTPEINFQINKEFNPEFIRGICYDGKTEPIAKLYLNDCVHVDRTYEADVRNSELADGGVMGGSIGNEPVVVG